MQNIVTIAMVITTVITVNISIIIVTIIATTTTIIISNDITINIMSGSYE